MKTETSNIAQPECGYMLDGKQIGNAIGLLRSAAVCVSLPGLAERIDAVAKELNAIEPIFYQEWPNGRDPRD